MSTCPVTKSEIPAAFGGRPVFETPLRFITPTLPDLDGVLQAYAPAYACGLITNGAIVERFEHAAAEYLRVRHCVAVSSCTSGLMLVLRALDLTGEVVLPSFTFFATGHAALWNRLRPVFADSEPDTWNIDPADVERKITGRTAAIIGVHVYGNPCDAGRLTEIAARRGLKLIFDAAHAFGSLHGDCPVGGSGDAEVFSLSPTKTLVAGEGGVVATNDALLARRLRAARNYGDSGSYDCDLLGLNARMPEFNAALALAGILLTETKIGRLNQIAAAYRAELGRLPGVLFQCVRPDDRSTWKDFSIWLDAGRGCPPDELAAALRAENVETRRYFHPPLHRQRLYRHFCTYAVPNAERISDGILSLPIYPSLADEQVQGVCAAIRRFAEYRSERGRAADV